MQCTESEHICGECARFKVPDSGCDMAYHISKGTLTASDPACEEFYPKNKSRNLKEKPLLHKASGLAQEGYYEAIYHEGKPAFLVKTKNDFTVLRNVTADDQKLAPKEWPSETPYEPYGFYSYAVPNPEDLFNKVRAEFDLFIDIDPIWKDFLAACTLLTYQQEKVRTVPYVYFVGDNESGKTVALTLLKWLCYRPLLGVTIPSADIYGYLDDADAPGTILEDEAQGLAKDTDKAKIYKAGYKRGATAPRTFITDHKRFIKYFRVFCFKACAAEEMPRVKGLLERFIFIPMIEGYPKKDWADLNREDEDRLKNLRNMLLKWRLETIEQELSESSLPAKGRLKELWKPIIQIVHGLPVEKTLLAHLDQLQQERIAEKTNTLEGHLVKVISALYEENKILPFTDVWTALVQDLEATQNEKTPNVADSAEFGLVSKRQIGYRLREVLNGKKRSVRAATGFTKGYEFDVNQLSRVARKYGIEYVSKCPINPEIISLTTLNADGVTVKLHENNNDSINRDAQAEPPAPQTIGHNGHTDTNPLSRFKSVYWSDEFYGWHPCTVCGLTKLTSWQAETFTDEKEWLCEDCQVQWEKQRENS